MCHCCITPSHCCTLCLYQNSTGVVFGFEILVLAKSDRTANLSSHAIVNAEHKITSMSIRSKTSTNYCQCCINLLLSYQLISDSAHPLPTPQLFSVWRGRISILSRPGLWLSSCPPRGDGPAPLQRNSHCWRRGPERLYRGADPEPPGRQSRPGLHQTALLRGGARE